MIVLFALLAATQVVATPTEAAQTAPSVLTPPTDWSLVPPLPWRVEPQPSAEFNTFVQRTIAAEHCPVSGTHIAVEVAVFLRSDGLPRAVVPRAIDCATVEQFASGLVSSLARSNVRLPASGWYRTTITFDWTK